VEAEAGVLYSEDAIAERVRELGDAITRDYADRRIVLVSILKGSAMFLADLIRAIDLPLRVDFMSISRYGGDEQTGVVRILQDLEGPILGDDVIVVEDIVDTGLTLSYLLSVLENREPASVEVCALLDKTVRRITPLRIRYQGFDCPDRFVVGYGMDYDERYRNMPDIYAVEERALKEDPMMLARLLDA
jgi:hypoxanthine phosphoribosyltransferase